MASIKPITNLTPKSQYQVIAPQEIYGPEDAEVRLRIATGGAGQTGLLKKLAEEFITFQTQNKQEKPFRIAWIATDTSLSFNALASGAADLSITYHSYAEMIALRQGIADRCVYAWRDHFMLVGPKKNPARLPTDQKSSILELFALLFQAAVSTATSAEPVRFLSRFDKSANNIRESHIWTSIGQTPWAEPYSSFYHRFVDFPYGALRAASQLGEYTLVDRGTWYAIDAATRENMAVYKETFDAAEDDPLINPAHALIGSFAPNKQMAEAFATWLIGEDGGQNVISKFAVQGKVLHSTAVPGIEPLAQVQLRGRL